MSRRIFDFSDAQKAILEDMLEEIFLLETESHQKDIEVSKFLNVESVSFEAPSNFSILYRCLCSKIVEIEKDLKVLDDMLTRLRAKECF